MAQLLAHYHSYSQSVKALTEITGKPCMAFSRGTKKVETVAFLQRLWLSYSSMPCSLSLHHSLPSTSGSGVLACLYHRRIPSLFQLTMLMFTMANPTERLFLSACSSLQDLTDLLSTTHVQADNDKCMHVAITSFRDWVYVLGRWHPMITTFRQKLVSLLHPVRE